MTTPLLHFFADASFLPVLLDITLKSTLLLALATLVVLAQRKSSAAARHLTWSVALLGAVLLPLLSWLLPSWPVLGGWWPVISSPPPAVAAPVSSVVSAANFAPVEMSQANPATVGSNEVSPSTQPAMPAVVPATPPTPSAQKFNLADFFKNSLGMIWLAGIGVALLPLLAGCWQVARLTRRCLPLADSEWAKLLQDSAASLNLRRVVRLLCGSGVALPMTWGARRPVLLLPEAAHAWTASRRRLVLLHELAHVKRWDWLTQILAYFACALFWYNPLAWHAARRMRLEREQACDDLVLRRNTRPSDYAGELLQLATGYDGRGLIDWVTVPMARRSALEGRLLAILDEKRNRAGLAHAAIFGAVVFAAVVIVPVAMLRAAPTAVDSPATTPVPPVPNLTLGKSESAASAAKYVTPLVNPHGLAMDKEGTLYVADYDQNIIYKLSPGGELSVLADHADEGGFAWPADLAVDQEKNVYVADSGRDVIRKITPDGKVTDFAGKVHIGGYTDGKGADARFHNATGIAIDSTGNLYVVDNDSFIVRKITPDGTVTTIAGQPEQSGSVDGPAAVARFAKPRAVAVGPDGSIYVVDEANNNIRKIALNGIVSTVAGEPGHNTGSEDGAGVRARFSRPRAVAVDARGNIYVADTDNNTIRKITRSNVVTTFAGKAGEPGYVDGAGVDARFNSPRGLTVDKDGNVYVADSNNSAIRKISPTGAVSTLYAPPRIIDAATNPFVSAGTATVSTPIIIWAKSAKNLSAGAGSSPFASSVPSTGTTTTVKLTSLDLRAWGPRPGAPTYTWGNGERHSPTLKIGGQEFADGITMIANGALYLNLAGGSDKFSATIGMDGGAPSAGANAPVKVIFRVLGDGKVLYESAPKQRGDTPEKISIDTRGIKTLALEVRVQGDYHTGQMRDADWADATFEVSGAHPQAVASFAAMAPPKGTPTTLGTVEVFVVGNVQVIRPRWPANATRSKPDAHTNPIAG